MHSPKLLSLTLCFALLAACSQTDEPSQIVETRDEAPRIFFDTDFGFDVDDVGALALLHALADRHEAEIVGVNSVVLDPHTPGAIDAVNTYYGRPDIPIGQNRQGPDVWRTAAPYWNDSQHRFNVYLNKRFDHDTATETVPSATANYRRVLSEQPDRSVTVVVTGFPENLAELLRSEPDEVSPLGGRELVVQKVKEVVVMGGASEKRDFNLTGGPAKSSANARELVRSWPTKIAFQNGEVCRDVRTGKRLSGDNPVGQAYRKFYGSKRRSRPSWDQCAVLQAVRGVGNVFRENDTKRLVIDGLKIYEKKGARRDQVLVRRVADAGALAKTIEDLMKAPPRLQN